MVLACVCFSTSTISRVAVGSGVYATLVAVTNGTMVSTVKPKLWNGGRKLKNTESFPVSRWLNEPSMSRNMFLCVSGTALGNDSLPDVNSITATSSGVTLKPGFSLERSKPLSLSPRLASRTFFSKNIHFSFTSSVSLSRTRSKNVPAVIICVI